LSADLRRAFPEMKGFSPRNLKYMRAFAEAYPDEQFVQQVVAQIPWGHNVRILDAAGGPAEREWYARQTIEHGWSRNVLVHQIESGLYGRQGKAVTNFERTLPADANKPVGVSTYQLTESLPKRLEGILPTVEDLEAELSEPSTGHVNSEDDL
jgi:predicted nuclease of restriction endonuclease-like (RecB) superfamily